MVETVVGKGYSVYFSITNVICRTAVFVVHMLEIIYATKMDAHQVGLWLEILRWRHEAKPFSALLPLNEGNPPVTGRFPLLWEGSTGHRRLQRGRTILLVATLHMLLNEQSNYRWREIPWGLCGVTVIQSAKKRINIPGKCQVGSHLNITMTS